MPAVSLDSLSPFGRLAVKLDGDFSELDRISRQLQRIEIDSDSGLERAVKLLEQFAAHGQSIAGGIQEFSNSLQAAREKSEAAARFVGERAQVVQERKGQQNQLRQKLGEVERKVKEINSGLAGFRKTAQAAPSDEDKRQITAQLERLHSQLADFIGTAQTIKQEAGRLRFKGIERETDALLDTLRSARRKLSTTLHAN